MVKDARKMAQWACLPKRVAGLLVTLPLALMAVPSSAGAPSGYRNILDFGCHKNDGTCYVTIDGAAVGDITCSSNSVRWDSKNDINGKTWLALIMAAKAQGKRVSFYIDGCYVNQPAYPTFGYGAIEG